MISDDYGGELDEPFLVSRHWALVKAISGSEKKEQDRLHDTAHYRFVIRTVNHLQEDDTIVWKRKRFNIRFIADQGQRHPYLSIEAIRNA